SAKILSGRTSRTRFRPDAVSPGPAERWQRRPRGAAAAAGTHAAPGRAGDGDRAAARDVAVPVRVPSRRRHGEARLFDGRGAPVSEPVRRVRPAAARGHGVWVSGGYDGGRRRRGVRLRSPQRARRVRGRRRCDGGTPGRGPDRRTTSTAPGRRGEEDVGRVPCQQDRAAVRGGAGESGYVTVIASVAVADPFISNQLTPSLTRSNSSR